MALRIVESAPMDLSNSGKPWTENDVRIATGFMLGYSDKYRSIEEIARKLKRSYSAVAQVQCKARWAKRFAEVL